MKRPARPRRQRKSDRLIHPGASGNEIVVDHALAPFDRMAIEMEHKWGVDRLVELVAPEMAAKYGSAMAKLNDAINAEDVEEVTLRVGVCMRGMAAMDQAATQAGAQPASDDVWLIQADGKQYGLMRDGRGWRRAQEKHPDVQLVTEREMILAIEMYRQSVAGQTIDAVKDSFPQAEVIKVKNTNIEDDIPW